MISLKDVEEIHKLLIDRFGGSHGIRDLSSLQSALSRPFDTFEGKELYPTVIAKAAALFQSLLSNHPFVDGNKRTGYVVTRLFFMNNGFDIEASQEEKYEFVMQVASGRSDFDQIAEWLARHLIGSGG